MAKVILPAQLARQTGGKSSFGVPGATAGAVLRALEAEAPALKGWVLDERGRLREHVSVFVNSESASLERPVADGDEIYVVQAISGGSTGGYELLVGTRKGLFVLRGERGGGPAEVTARAFAGQTVEFALRDPRSGTFLAAVTHGQFGPKLFRAEDPGGEWEQCDGPAFPEDAGAAVDRIWIVRPGEAKDELWAGVAPAALFRSGDGGHSWELNHALWNHPTRREWEGGAGGLCLHSICPWPGDPQRLSVGISSAGVWHTNDGGKSWRRGVDGLVPRYLPEEAHADTLMHCVHHLERCPTQPQTLYMQFHGGVYRSDDGGARWIDIAGLGRDDGLPSDFGFPLVAHPRDPDCAYVIPLVADVDRVTPEGRLRVYATRDRGASWRALERGLPQRDAYLTILRQAFCHDGGEPLGLYFGTEQGTLYGSSDGGETWAALAENLPPIVAVQAA